jgi:hypothetical protein
MRDFGINWDTMPRKAVINPEAVIDGDVLHVPLERKYQLVTKIVDDKEKKTNSFFDNFPVRGYFSNVGVKIKYKKLYHDTQELAVEEFLLDEASDPWIVALFEAPHVVEFAIEEYKVVQLFDDKDNTITLSSAKIREGEDLKQEFLNSPRFREVYEEIQREKTKVERMQQEEEKQRDKDKREAFYHQWKWLEKKRESGEFDEFIDDRPQNAENGRENY